MGIYDVFEGGSQPFDKAAWIAKKNEEKQAAYELADSTADRMKTDGDAFRSYLDVQGRFDRYSVTNAILVAAQKPDATQLKDFKKWREDGVTVDKDATKITILEPGNEYTRHDGTRTMGFNAKTRRFRNVGKGYAGQCAAPSHAGIGGGTGTGKSRQVCRGG